MRMLAGAKTVGVRMYHLSMIKYDMEVEFIKGMQNEATNWISFE